MEGENTRVLYDTAHTSRFLTGTLGLSSKRKIASMKFDDVVAKISDAEKILKESFGKDTLSSTADRSPSFVDEKSRVALREKIYSELIHQEQLDNDDNIELGRGGAIPKCGIRYDREAFYVIGLPASGKSKISSDISRRFGALILDSDYAKRKFPEYKRIHGASMVHEESSAVIFGNKRLGEPTVLEYAIVSGCNIVIPKIGNNLNKVVDFSKKLKESGYTVHLVLVRLDRKKATIRACTRFIKTGRYVPLSLIFDVYGNDPTISFYDSLIGDNGLFSSFTMYTTDVPKKVGAKIIYASEFSPLA